MVTSNSKCQVTVTPKVMFEICRWGGKRLERLHRQKGERRRATHVIYLEQCQTHHVLRGFIGVGCFTVIKKTLKKTAENNTQAFLFFMSSMCRHHLLERRRPPTTMKSTLSVAGCKYTEWLQIISKWGLV